MLENPLRWRARYRNYWMFQRQIETSGAILYTCEIAFGGRDFEITEPNNPRHLQLRASSELWRKENALNLLGQRLPPEAKYLAWIDADVQFARPDWAQETLHLLQHYDVIQMFSHIQNIGPSYEPLTFVEAFYGITWRTGRRRILTISRSRGQPVAAKDPEAAAAESGTTPASPGPAGDRLGTIWAA